MKILRIYLKNLNSLRGEHEIDLEDAACVAFDHGERLQRWALRSLAERSNRHAARPFEGGFARLAGVLVTPAGMNGLRDQ